MCIHLAGMAAEDLFLDRAEFPYGIFLEKSDLARALVKADNVSYCLFHVVGQHA